MPDQRPRFRLRPDERLISAETVWWGTNPTGTVTHGGTLYVTDQRLALGRRNRAGTALTVIIGLPLLLASMVYVGWAGPMIVVFLYIGWHAAKPYIRRLPGQHVALEAKLVDVVGFRVQKQPGFFAKDTVALTMGGGELWRIAASGKSSSVDGVARRLRTALGRDPEQAPR